MRLLVFCAFWNMVYPIAESPLGYCEMALFVSTCLGRSWAARPLIWACGLNKSILIIACSNCKQYKLDRQLYWISIPLSKVFYSHILLSQFLLTVFLSSSQLLRLYENIRNICWFSVWPKHQKKCIS